MKYINTNTPTYLYEMIKHELGNACSSPLWVSKDEGDISFIEFNIWDHKREPYNNLPKRKIIKTFSLCFYAHLRIYLLNMVKVENIYHISSKPGAISNIKSCTSTCITIHSALHM